MATPRSFAPLLLLVAVSVISSAVLASRVQPSESLTKACNATSRPDTCANVLKSNPESATASPRRLAELAFQYLAKDGPLLLAKAKSRLAAAKDEAVRGCLQTLDGNLGGFVGSVAASAVPDQGDAKFNQAKDNLTKLLQVPSTSGTACNEAAIAAEPVVSKIYRYEDMLQVTLDLMEAASKKT